MKVGERAKIRKQAIATLVEAEFHALSQLARDNTPENRAHYREVHETLQVVRAERDRHSGFIVRFLKLLKLAP